MKSQASDNELAFLEGFINKCSEYKVDPEQLLNLLTEKKSQLGDEAEELATSTGKGALRGGLAGAAAGGAVGASVPLIAAAAMMLKYPQLRHTTTLDDLGKVLAQSGKAGIAGAIGGGATGSMLGGISGNLENKPKQTRTQAAISGAGKGMLAGGALGALGGLAIPGAAILGAKAHGATLPPKEKILKALMMSTIGGAGMGAIGGAPAGAALGAALHKGASQKRSAAIPINPFGQWPGKAEKLQKIREFLLGTPKPKEGILEILAKIPKTGPISAGNI